jgi:serine/threonine protein kinase
MEPQQQHHHKRKPHVEGGGSGAAHADGNTVGAWDGSRTSSASSYHRLSSAEAMREDVDEAPPKVRVVVREDPHHPPPPPLHDGSSSTGSNDSAYSGKNKGKNPSVTHDPTFLARYTLGEQIGTGASSTVWKCREISSGAQRAAKVIDLRPLKLRSQFSMDRVRREVDIMRRLRHPNIIRLFETFESSEQLIMVLEYAPGVELFDAIISKKRFTEDEARPIFVQVARAVLYLHSMSILHRDIKPENIMVQDTQSQDGLYPQVKLLDFGLSKSVGDGVAGYLSAAKTFVGTPCYLAPEVEERSRGEGGSYGIAVDCWSLGAVLYVMLVARFPEFTIGPSREKVVRMVGPAWDAVSFAAKDLISGLMQHNPGRRLTVEQSLQHPWTLALAPDELAPVIQTVPSPSLIPKKVLKAEKPTTLAVYNSVGGMVPGNSLNITPLLQLHTNIASCLEAAVVSYQSSPHAAVSLRKSAILCRENLISSMKLLRKIEQTASQVLELFPDLMLAVEEGEPTLAHDFFSTVKTWVGALYHTVHEVQAASRANTREVADLMEVSVLPRKEHVHPLQETESSEAETAESEEAHRGKLLTVDAHTFEVVLRMQRAQNAGVQLESLSEEQIVELFLPTGKSDTSGMSESPTSPGAHQTARSVAGDGAAFASLPILTSAPPADSSPSRQMSIDVNETSAAVNRLQLVSPTQHSPTTGPSSESSSASTPSMDSTLAQALKMLHDVDGVLEQLALFWANTEVIFDVLLRKGDMVEKFVQFGHKPKLMHRFQERMQDYQRFWASIRELANSYICGQRECCADKFYSFISTPGVSFDGGTESQPCM